MSKKKKFTASVWPEEEWWIAQCLQVDVASQGQSEQEALDNLKEALELHFEPSVDFNLSLAVSESL